METDNSSALRLQEATIAIEAAYQRIEQARRSLRELAARNSGTIDPGHRAIVLTNPQSESQPAQLQGEPSEFDEIVERFISALSERNSARFRRATNDLRTRTATNPAWLSFLQSQPQRRTSASPSVSSEDDGITMHGRIVASRFPPVPATIEESTTDPAAESSSSATQIAQERPVLGRLHLPPSNFPPNPERFYPTLRGNRLSRVEAPSSGTGTRTSTSSSGRLSLLSNSSMYNTFQTPTSSVSREQSMLLFDEPSTMAAEPERRRSILIPQEVGEGRNYTLVRRYDERGDEVVAQVTVPNDSLAFANRRPQRPIPSGTNEPPTQQRRRLFTATNTSSPLIENGDYWGPGPYDPVATSGSNIIHEFIPAEDELDMSPLRPDDVTRALPVYYGFSSFEVSTLEVDGVSQEIVYIGSSRPYKANPLPLPLPDFTPVKPTPKPPRVISRQASLAAR